MTETVPTTGALFPLPGSGGGERSDPLLERPGLRIERIVSRGHASPAGFWYDQDEAEWVLVVEGRARLLVAGELRPRELGPGDWIHLPARCRHRVEWTDPERETVWLAVFYTQPHEKQAE